MMWLFYLGYVLPTVLLAAYIVYARAVIPKKPNYIKWILLFLTITPVVNIVTIGALIQLWNATGEEDDTRL